MKQNIDIYFYLFLLESVSHAPMIFRLKRISINLYITLREMKAGLENRQVYFMIMEYIMFLSIQSDRKCIWKYSLGACC